MRPEEKAMLICGIVLFLAALAVLIVQFIKSKPLKPAYALFAIAVVMIGFPSIKAITLPGGGGIEKNAVSFQNDPESAKARTSFDNSLDQELAETGTNHLSPQAVSNLKAVVATLGPKTNLSAESRMTLSKAQLVLGQTNEAALTLGAAVKSNARLAVDSKLKFLLEKP